MRKGLLAVFTGDGKGKTTAALGLTFRALGHGHKVAFIQFIKGRVNTGEAEAARLHAPNLYFKVMGRGFTWKTDDKKKDIEAAREAWIHASAIIQKNEHNMVVLDELTYLFHYQMIDEKEVLQVINDRPESMHIVITGRGAPKALLQQADLVTEMQAVKHPYATGIKAQKGFEF